MTGPLAWARAWIRGDAERSAGRRRTRAEEKRRKLILAFHLAEERDVARDGTLRTGSTRRRAEWRAKVEAMSDDEVLGYDI